MIKEIQFGSAVKLGKTLELSYHAARDSRWEISMEGDVFIFKDSKGEFPTTLTTKANVKFWIVDNVQSKKASKS